MAFLRRAFGIDLRSLALFRIAIAILLLGDLAIRATALEAHYTDFGVLPRAALLATGEWREWYLCVHLLNGTFEVQAALFGVAAVALGMLLVGYRTRPAAVVSYVLLASLHTRNPLLLQGGDNLVRLLLFWALFLPLGARASLDARRRPSAEPDAYAFSFASAGLLLQPVWMYFFTALFKDGAEWHVDGTAIYYALHIEQFAKPFAVWVRQFPDVMRRMTFAVWWVEMCGPLFFFSPLAFVPLRTLAILAFLSLQFGFFLSMELAIFPWVSSIALIPFLPKEFWHALAAYRPENWRAGLRALGRGLATANTASFAGRAPQPPRGRVATGAIALPRPVTAPWYVNALAGFLAAYVFLWNSSEVKTWNLHAPASLDWIGDGLRIDQLWNMFAPYPARDDGWYVISGRLADGSAVDLYRSLLRGETIPPTRERPPRLAAQYPNDRWRSYLMNLWQVKYEAHRPFYAEYLCRAWNRGHEGAAELLSLEIAFMDQEVQPDYRVKKAEYTPIWYQRCGAGAENSDAVPPAEEPSPAPVSPLRPNSDFAR